MTTNRKLVAIMFTDIEGYTKLMQGDEEQAIRFRTKHREIFNGVTKKFNGTVLQYYGDGTLSIFNSVIDAVNCGIELQLGLVEEPTVPVRIGIHIGDIVHSKEEIIGDGVNVASRVESLAVAGSVFVSDKVYEEVKNQPTIQTKRLRRVKLKNVERIMEVYAIANPGLVVPNAEDLNGKTERIPEFHKKIRRAKLLRVGGVALLFVLASLAVFLMNKPDGDEVHASEVLPPPNSIAVLAFENMSGDAEEEYFSDGISEEILNYLAKVKGLKVAGRTSAFSFKGKNVDLRSIGKKLKVGMVLEGSVRRANDRVRITAQLINVTDGFHIWSETYDREMKDIFAIQDEIALKIAEKLKLSLRKDKPQQDINVEAYDQLLKGIHFLNKDFEGTIKGLEYCKKAVEIDPTFASAYAHMGDAYINHSIYGFMSNTEAYSKAREAAEKAIEINADEARAHRVLAYVKLNYDWNWDGALNEYNRALECGLQDPDHFITLYDIIIKQDFTGSINASEKILERDLLHTQSHWHVGLSNLFAKNFDAAIKSFDNAIELNANYSEGHRWKALALAFKQEYALADSSLAKALKITNGKGPAQFDKLFVMALQGKKDIVLATIEAWIAAGAQIDPIGPASLYAVLGMNDKAIDWLEKAYSQRSYMMISLKFYWIWDGLRDDPRFKEIYRKMNFPV